MTKRELKKSFIELVDHLLNRGELVKAYMVAINSPSYLEGDVDVLVKRIALSDRLEEISEMQNHGTIKGKFNSAFIDPENPDEIVKFKLLMDFIKGKDIKKIVDVGSYTGWLGRRLSQEGIAVHGIDIHPVINQIAAFAASGTLATFEYLPVEKLGFTYPSKFDCAVLFDVLEHVFDPSGVIKSVEKSVKKGGSVVINVPSVEGEMAANIHPVDHHEHLHSFTKTDLSLLFEGRKNFKANYVDNEGKVKNWFITYDL